MFVRAGLGLGSFVLAAAVAIAASDSAPKKAPTATQGGAATEAASAVPSSDCGGSREIDRCLVGNWEMTVDGALAYARSKLQGVKVDMKSEKGKTMSLKADGTFSTGRVEATVTAEKDNTKMASSSVAQASGRWSATTGKLNYCATALQHQSTTTMMIGGKKVIIPVKPAGGPSVATYSYTCAGDKLVQVMMIGKDSMTSEFRRIP